MPHVQLGPTFPSGSNGRRGRRREGARSTASQVEISQIIKGCWQLDGQHMGNPKTDRTTGTAAVADFDKFHLAGLSLHQL